MDAGMRHSFFSCAIVIFIYFFSLLRPQIADIDATTELEPLLTEEDVNRRCLPPLHHMIHGNMDLITSHLVEKDRRDLVQHFLEVMGDIPDD